MFFKKGLSQFSRKLDVNIQHFMDGKLSYISSIFNVFREKDVKAKLKVSKFFVELIEEKSFDTFLRITEHMHGSFNLYCDNSKWLKIRNIDIFTNEMTSNEKRAILIFASFHSNGYLRERAIKELVNYPNTLQYILIRRNDWVREVRNTAKRLLIEKFKNLTENEMLYAIPAIEKLIKCERDNFMEEYEIFILNLLRNDNEFSNGLKSSDSKTRLFCAKLLLKKNAEIEKVKMYLFQENLPHNRDKIYNLYLNTNVNEEILDLMLTDNYAKIRMTAINYIYSNKLKTYSFAFGYLLDKNANIRELARYVIKENEKNFSFRDYYLNALKKSRFAIAGLGETGVKDDTGLIEQYLTDESFGVVRITINALIKLDKEKYLENFILLLNDQRKGIVKDISVILSKEVQLYEEKIKSIFNNSKNSYTRFKCAELLFKVSKWNALNNMIMLLNDDDLNISDLSKMAIIKWIAKFNKSFIPLDNKQKEVIVQNVSKIKRKDISIEQLMYYIS